MRNLWLRIGLGALAVFAFGMMGITLVRQARTAVVDAVTSQLRQVPQAVAARTLVESGLPASPATLAALGSVGHSGGLDVEIPFRLNGTEIGRIQRFNVARTRANGPVDIRVTVGLTEPGFQDMIAGCSLTPLDHSADPGVGFRCVESEETGLAEAGTVRFEPVGLERPLYLPRDSDAFHSHGKVFAAQADLSSDVRVRVDGHDGILDLNANEGGASLHVTDNHGNPIVRLEADQNGAFIRIRDRNGRELFRLNAGQGRVDLKADASH